MAQDPQLAIINATGPRDGRVDDKLFDLERSTRALRRDARRDTIGGRVESDGTRMAGAGFSSSRLGLGLYRLTFSRPAYPYWLVTAMAGREPGVTLFKQRDGTTPTQLVFELQAHDAQTGAIWDCDFLFTAVRP